MANVFATKNGNWSDTTVWNTGALPTAADDVYSNNFTVAANITTTVLSIRNGSASGINAGGGFTAVNGVTLTCTGSGVLTSQVNQIAAVFQSSLTAGQSFTIVGNVTGGVNNNHGVINSSNGTLTITGNVTGGTGNASSFGVQNAASGTVVITGNVTGGNGTTAHGANNASTGVLTITGICRGGPGTGSGANNASTGTINHTGTAEASNTSPAISGTNANQITILSGPFLTSTNGINPVTCGRWFWANSNVTPTYYEIRTANLATIRPLYTADSVGGNPAITNVRSGTVYGPAGELTGTCAVPPAGSVAFGVPVDNTTGTAVLTPDSVRSAVGLASANLDAQLDALPTATEIAQAVWSAIARTVTGGTVNTTETVSSPGTIATAVWAVATSALTGAGTIGKLLVDNVDTAISSRLPTSSYTPPPSTADISQAVWTYSTRILSSVSDIVSGVWSATTRTVTGGTIDSVANLDAPTEAEIAAAVRAELATELSRIDVATSTRLAPDGTLARVTLTDTTTAVTDTAAIADAVRTELTPELARVANAATTQEVADIVEGAIEPPN